MAYRHLELERDGAVLTCSISNPPTHTLTATGVGELHQFVDEVEADPEIRVLVFTGGGVGVFIAHYEVGELAESQDAAGLPQHRQQAHGVPPIRP